MKRTYTSTYHREARLRKGLELFREKGRETIRSSVVVKVYTKLPDCGMAKVCWATLVQERINQWDDFKWNDVVPVRQVPSPVRMSSPPVIPSHSVQSCGYIDPSWNRIHVLGISRQSSMSWWRVAQVSSNAHGIIRKMSKNLSRLSRLIP